MIKRYQICVSRAQATGIVIIGNFGCGSHVVVKNYLVYFALKIIGVGSAADVQVAGVFGGGIRHSYMRPLVCAERSRSVAIYIYRRGGKASSGDGTGVDPDIVCGGS